MNSINSDNTSRPFGYWLKATDRLMAAEFATAFESEGASRREWRLLNVVDGTAAADHPMPAHKLDRLIELGWVTDADGTWSLTDEGRAAKERLGALVDGIRAKVTDAVSTEDLATTLASLEQIARAFGWDENTTLPSGSERHPRGFGRRGFGPRGFGHGRRGFGGDPRVEHGDDWHGFDGRAGCEHGHDRGHGSGRDRRAEGHRPEHDSHEHGHRFDPADRGGHGRPSHREHGPRRFAHVVQHSFERGFDAGFNRGREV